MAIKFLVSKTSSRFCHKSITKNMIKVFKFAENSPINQFLNLMSNIDFAGDFYHLLKMIHLLPTLKKSTLFFTSKYRYGPERII